LLWGENRFGYIFFFDSEFIDLDWQTFLEHIDYSPNYDPRGQFHSVADRRLEKWGGIQGYVRHLRASHASSLYFPNTTLSSFVREITTDSQGYEPSIDHELRTLASLTNDDPPRLTADTEHASVTQLVKPRDAAFKILVKQAYGSRCAVCQSGVESPSGIPEVQSAHIYPRELRGSDDPRNGICLCRLHHWAFDVGWFAIRDDLSIVVSSSLPNDSDYDFIRDFANLKISVPNEERFRPHPIFLRGHRTLHNLA
jgi:putative restriction endonuclease